MSTIRVGRRIWNKGFFFIEAGPAICGSGGFADASEALNTVGTNDTELPSMDVNVA